MFTLLCFFSHRRRESAAFLTRWHQLEHWRDAHTVYLSCWPVSIDNSKVWTRGAMCDKCGHVDVNEWEPEKPLMSGHLRDRCPSARLWTTCQPPTHDD